jgi:hypothetical protein
MRSKEKRVKEARTREARQELKDLAWVVDSEEH